MKTYFTASELSRELGIPVNRIITAVETGILAADGRAGSNKNSALIFAIHRVREIEAAVGGGHPATQTEPARDISEVSAKAAAIHRAKQEGAK
jgi:hypothetical protein